MAEALEALRDALNETGIAVDDGEATGPDDVRLPIHVDDRSLTLGVVVVAYCTGDRARLLISHAGPQAGVIPFVVAERMTTEGRNMLTEAGWSWLDRRGRLSLRAMGIRVDMEVAASAARESSSAGSAIRGLGGLVTAYWLCAHPGERLSPTGHAPALGIAPSTISVASTRLSEAGLVDEGAGVFPELFWELAGAWRPERTWLVRAPRAEDHRNPDPLAPTWCRTGTAAAAALGAPVVAAVGGPVDLLVPGPVAVTIAVRRHEQARAGAGAARVAPAPVLAATRPDVVTPITVDGWPAAPSLAVALDLAQDRARGREILNDWSHDGAVWR